MRVSNDVLQRAIAWGKSRARAVSSTQSIVADSIDVVMPNQRLREMHAVRGAVAEGAPDTTKFRTTERDRLTGDTIVAHFDTAASAIRDTTSKPRIQRLVSRVDATSIQHLPARDTTVRTPAIVYVTGQAIDSDLRFRYGEAGAGGERQSRFGAVPGTGIRQHPSTATGRRGSSSRRAGRRRSGHCRALAPIRAADYPRPIEPCDAGADRAPTRALQRHARSRDRSTPASMTTPPTPPMLQALVDRLARGDRSAALALHAVICVADADGNATFNDAAVQYRNDHLGALRASGADAEREAGRLSMDEVRQNLATSVLPRLASDGIVDLPAGGLQSPDARVPHQREGVGRDQGDAGGGRRRPQAHRRAPRDSSLTLRSNLPPRRRSGAFSRRADW